MLNWLITSTTYGTWLPGDPRGSVTSVRPNRASDRPQTTRLEHDRVGESPEGPIPGLYLSSQRKLKGPPVRFTKEQADILSMQFLETASWRGWRMRAIAIMANHFHAVVSAPEEVQSTKIVADLKAYGTRALNENFGVPVSETWWTSGGSRRQLPGRLALECGLRYVLFKQEHPLTTWAAEVLIENDMAEAELVANIARRNRGNRPPRWEVSL